MIANPSGSCGAKPGEKKSNPPTSPRKTPKTWRLVGISASCTAPITSMKSGTVLMAKDAAVAVRNSSAQKAAPLPNV